MPTGGDQDIITTLEVLLDSTSLLDIVLATNCRSLTGSVSTRTTMKKDMQPLIQQQALLFLEEEIVKRSTILFHLDIILVSTLL